MVPHLHNFLSTTLHEPDIIQVSQQGFNRLFLPTRSAKNARRLVEVLKSSSEHQDLEIEIVGVYDVVAGCRLEEAFVDIDIESTVS